jgi:hypothetical protein
MSSFNLQTVIADHVTYMSVPLQGEDGLDRLWFVVKQRPRTQGDYGKCITLANCYYYSNIMGCDYHPMTKRKIDEILQGD